MPTLGPESKISFFFLVLTFFSAEKEAYCSVVGLGLGAWQVLADQGLWMLESYVGHHFNFGDNIFFEVSFFATPFSVLTFS